MSTSQLRTDGTRPLSRRDFARLTTASLTIAAAPPQAALLGALAPKVTIVDEEALRASAIFMMSF